MVSYGILLNAECWGRFFYFYHIWFVESNTFMYLYLLLFITSLYQFINKIYFSKKNVLSTISLCCYFLLIFFLNFFKFMILKNDPKKPDVFRFRILWTFAIFSFHVYMNGRKLMIEFISFIL